MSKRPAKRKAASYNANYADVDDGGTNNLVVDDTASLLASLNLSNSKTTPRAIATCLLTLLPDGATKQHAEAKKLLKAFPLVTAELDARSAAQLRASESTGTSMPISFHFQDEDGSETTVVNVPEDSFLNIMSFLRGKDIVDASTVNKAWLSISRQPALWKSLDASSGLTNSSRKLNMTYLLKLLGRPQFANLKSLAIPYKIKLGKTSCKQIAKVCPHLETLDLGWAGSYFGPKAKDHDLLDAAEHFTNLTSIRTDMYNVTSSGISAVAQAMGEQLLDLRVSCICFRYLSDDTLQVLATSCPNLKHFAYKANSSYGYSSFRDRFTGVGVLALVEGCRRLEVLELENARNVRKDTFVTIANLVVQGNEVASAGGNGVYALRQINLKGYPFTVSDFPFRVEDTEGYVDSFARNMRHSQALENLMTFPL